MSTVLVQVPRGLLPLIFVTNLASIKKIGLRAQTGTALHSFYGWKEEERCVGSRKELVLKGYAKTHTSAVESVLQSAGDEGLFLTHLDGPPSDHYPGLNGSQDSLMRPCQDICSRSLRNLWLGGRVEEQTSASEFGRMQRMWDSLRRGGVAKEWTEHHLMRALESAGWSELALITPPRYPKQPWVIRGGCLGQLGQEVAGGPRLPVSGPLFLREAKVNLLCVNLTFKVPIAMRGTTGPTAQYVSFEFPPCLRQDFLSPFEMELGVDFLGSVESPHKRCDQC